MRVGAATDVGRVREINEDGYLAGSLVFAVADGMGGHDAGEVASSIAIEALRERGFQLEDPIGEIRAAFSDINSRIHERARTDPTCAGMGTTLTLLIFRGQEAYVGHVGDSRLYVLRDGGLKQLTEDHSIVWELVRHGEITEEEARFHPHRNIITRALGTFPSVEPDVFGLEVLKGDTFLLCTDGLSSELEGREIAEILSKSPSPEEAPSRLVEAALRRGGADNITAVVVYVE